MYLFSTAKPFLKWAGGKKQLISDIKNVLPKNITNKKFTYIEPFVGSGAVLFWILNNYPNLERAIINDINPELINTYRNIANSPYELIKILETLQKEFHFLEGNKEKKKEYFYQKRAIYNNKTSDKVMQSALFIFLNKTCFNGLYRVNSKDEYNVPMGNYKKPTICDHDNIIAVSESLQKVEILCGDFCQTLSYADENTLFYLDPPYKPLNDTSNFNSYSKETFDDNEQIRLKKFCEELDRLGYCWILSNSDVKGTDNSNYFFDDLYADFIIQRVNAKRIINSKADKRGILTELLITNNFLL